jgi:membrane protein implicated in regulation of membrane protease activity
VTAAVDNIHGQGQVKLGAMEWTARSTTGDPIPVETLVRVDRIEGVKVFVTPVEVAATV